MSTNKNNENNENDNNNAQQSLTEQLIDEWESEERARLVDFPRWAQ